MIKFIWINYAWLVLVVHWRSNKKVTQKLLIAIQNRHTAEFFHWLEAGLNDLGLNAMKALLLDELLPVLNDEECDRIVAWRLGVSLGE